MNKRVELVFGIICAIVVVAVAVHITLLSYRLNSQHEELVRSNTCNRQLIDVLQTRSDARNVVDSSTRDAQAALVSYLNDIIESGSPLAPNDPHVIDVRDKFAAAAQARNDPSLFRAYPTC